jgi:F-box-like
MDRPSPDEIRTARETIRNHEREVNSIDITISGLSEKLCQLKAERKSCLDVIAKCRGLLSLAPRLPDDVLILIFEHSVREWVRAPLVVSGVCAKWRRASFFPRLWSHIQIYRDSANGKDSNLNAVARTHLWLSRALQSPLYVTFDDDTMPCGYASELILDRASQWRTLTVRTSYVSQASAILSKCRRPLPNLHSLHVICEKEHEDELFLIGLEEVFVNAPSLSVIRIFSNSFPPSLPQTVVDLYLDLNCSCRRSFCLSDAKVLTPLPALQKLQRLTLVIDPQYSQPIITPEDLVPNICLQHLECLIIHTQAGYYNPILRYLRTPILRCLHLQQSQLSRYCKHHREDIGKILLQFLRSSKPPIRLLELIDVDIPSDDMAQCFFSLPLLEELCLDRSAISEDALFPLYGPKGTCPRLKRVFLYQCKNLAGQALIDLVRSRVDSSGNQSGPSFDRIEKITVIHCALVNDSHILDLARITVCNVVEWDLEDHLPPSHQLIGPRSYW